MRILVTGGAGFIGKHLCERLTRDGHEVTSLDLNETTALVIDGGAVKHQVRLPVQLVSAQEYGDIEGIYHLACPASPKHYMADPIGTLDTAFNGTKAVLDTARQTGARVLLASTSEVYGNPSIHPQPEWYHGNVNPFGPRAMYDEGKRVAEALAWAYFTKHKVDVRVARIFNTYGPGMGEGDGRVVSTFISQALRGVPLTVHGGSQTRSLCYIDDMVEGLVRLMNEDSYCAPINLGSPGEVTVRELAEEILALTGSSSPVLYDDKPQDDPDRRCPDIGKAKILLGWEPKIPRAEGLKRTIAWWRER